jgi:hypothetical protein
MFSIPRLSAFRHHGHKRPETTEASNRHFFQDLNGLDQTPRHVGEWKDSAFGAPDHLETVLFEDVLQFLRGKVEGVNEGSPFIPRRLMSGIPKTPSPKHPIDVGQEKQTISVGKAEDHPF